MSRTFLLGEKFIQFLIDTWLIVMKIYPHRSEFPGRFGSIEDARAFCQDFFGYYNKEHRHSGIGLVTPEQLHYGQAQEVYDQRCIILKNAFEKKPERFRGKISQPPALPEAAWIKKTKQEKTDVIRV